MKKIMLLWILVLASTMMIGCGEGKVYVDGVFRYRIQNERAEIFALTEEGQLLNFIDFPTEIDGYPVTIGSAYGFGFDDNTARMKSDNLEIVIIREGNKVLSDIFQKITSLKYVILLHDEVIQIQGIFAPSARKIVLDELLTEYRGIHGNGFSAAKVSFYLEESLYHLSYDDEVQIFEPEKPTKDGFTFVGWSITGKNEDLFDFNEPFDYNKSIKLYAVWQEN